MKSTQPIAPIDWRHVPDAEYRFVVDLRLTAAFGTTTAELFAETWVRAMQRSGFTPQESAAWLSRIDEL